MLGNVIFYDTKEEAYKNIKEEGRRIQFCSDELKHDRELCLLAVKENGLALQFLPIEMKDKEIITEAVRENPFAYCCIRDVFEITPRDEMEEFTRSLVPIIFQKDKNFREHVSLDYCEVNKDTFWVTKAIQDFKTKKQLETWDEHGRPDIEPVFEDEKEALKQESQENDTKEIQNKKQAESGEEI